MDAKELRSRAEVKGLEIAISVLHGTKATPSEVYEWVMGWADKAVARQAPAETESGK